MKELKSGITYQTHVNRLRPLKFYKFDENLRRPKLQLQLLQTFSEWVNLKSCLRIESRKIKTVVLDNVINTTRKFNSANSRFLLAIGYFSNRLKIKLSDLSICIRSKAIYCTSDVELTACMQAEVMSTRVQKLPQLRLLAEITLSTENVLFVPNWVCKK